MVVAVLCEKLAHQQIGQTTLLEAAFYAVPQNLLRELTRGDLMTH
jgi:hypothetical protein